MKVKLKFSKNSFGTKNDFSLKLLPTIWMIHRSTENQKKFAKNYNKKSEKKVMYDYTSFYLSWLVWHLSLTFGKE